MNRLKSPTIKKTKAFLMRRFFAFIPYVICLLFFIAYSTLSIVRHQHYQSFGYDLGINDQVVWLYSQFKSPVTTIAPFPDKPKLVEHVELVYILLAPFYWIWSTRRMLLLVRNAWFCLSGIAVYLLARKKGLKNVVSIPLLISYLTFYGVQNAIWFDVHSVSFATAFLMWFLYFLETRKNVLSVVFFFLAITAKENIALLTGLSSVFFFMHHRSKLLGVFITVSVVYLLFIFYVYFPYIVHMKYLYADSAGIFSHTNPLLLVDTVEKRQVWWYSFLSYGFLPLLSPVALLPFLGDIATYFVFGSNLPGAQGLSMHYRITLTPFLTLATIYTIARFKWMNTWYIGVYLLIMGFGVSYALHLPLSYLSKSWFWYKSPAVKTINETITTYLPEKLDDSVVAQNNIIPHLSERDYIYTLYPEKKKFLQNSPCSESRCDWFRWYGSPHYLLVDTSTQWDTRHLLVDRPHFIIGITNLEKANVITLYNQKGTTKLYTINRNPETYK